MPTGVNLNQYSGSGSCIPWHSDDESLFGPPNQPKLTVGMCRVMCPLQLRWTMVTFWSWMVQRNRSMYIARCLGCRVLGLTLLTVGLHNMLRPVHLQAYLVVFSQRVRKVWSSQVPVGWGKGKINGPLLGDWSSFCQSW